MILVITQQAFHKKKAKNPANGLLAFFSGLLIQSILRVEQEVADVTVLHHVVLAFDTQFSFVADL